jgi:hypothetical protein
MARRKRGGSQLLRVSRRQLAGLGVVGLLGVAGGLNAALDLAEKLARLAHGKSPSGAPVREDEPRGPYVR